jgi:hypothetical protein
MIYNTIVIRSFLSALCCFLVLDVHAESTVRRYELPDHGRLALEVPDGWVDNVRQPPERLPPTISFKQKSSAAFDILITPIWPFDPAKRLTPAKVEEIVRDSAKKAEPQAVERKLEVRPLKGTSGSGHYFFATDKAPAPGEHKYMTQGALTVGELLVTFTILTNPGQTDIAKQALDMLTTARHIAGK